MGYCKSWKTEFIKSLRQQPVIGRAAAAAGVCRDLPYLERRADPDFAASWDAALMESRRIYAAQPRARRRYENVPMTAAAAVGNIDIAATWGIDTTGASVYVLRESWRGLVKIGHAKDIKGRVAAIQSGIPQSIDLVALFRSNRGRALETFIHSRFNSVVYRGEWFQLTQEDIGAIVDVYRTFCEADGQPVDYWLA